jgi:hypothetical protein
MSSSPRKVMLEAIDAASPEWNVASGGKKETHLDALQAVY